VHVKCWLVYIANMFIYLKFESYSKHSCTCHTCQECLFCVYSPPVNPPKEITDVNDKKPSDWDERERCSTSH